MFGEDNLKKNEIKERATLVAKYEKDAEWNKAKRKWKDDNPEQNIKDWKQAFVSGRIHELPGHLKKKAMYKMQSKVKVQFGTNYKTAKISNIDD